MELTVVDASLNAYGQVTGSIAHVASLVADSLQVEALENVDVSAARVSLDAGRSLEVAEFIQLMQSDAVCVWKECEHIAERRRKDAARAKAEEEARDPPMWTRLVNFVSGSGKDSKEGE